MFLLLLIFFLSASLLYITQKTSALGVVKDISENNSEDVPSLVGPTSPIRPAALSHNATPSIPGTPVQSQLSKQGDNTDLESGSEKLEEISPDSITIAIFCALAYEAVAVEHMLDEEYACSPKATGPIKYVYSFGRIKQHKIVIAQPHQMGVVAAAHCATAVSQQFPNVRFAMMVGIGAGIPSQKHDIRLGDIAVSIPQDAHAGAIQYDFGKYELDGFVLKGCLNKPPPILTSADKWLEREELKNKQNPLQKTLRRIAEIPKFSRPGTADILFGDSFHHINKGANCDACEALEEKIVVSRTTRPNQQPIVHRGLILSGNGVIKNPQDRESLRRYTDAICFEMEAAGIMDEIPCLIVRGICDYADTHKQDGWHYYAAAVAAAYCRTLLRKIDSQGVEDTEGRLAEGMESLVKIVSEFRDAQGVLNERTKYIEQSLDLKELKTVPGAEYDSYENQHEDCLPGTRVELLRQLEEWTTSPDGKCIFWLNGKAGTGKSTISRTVASLLRGKGLLGASFFFKRGEEDRASGKKLFPTLVAQLANNIPQLRPFIQEALKGDPRISEKVLNEQFKKLLLEPLLQMDHRAGTATTRVVIIDALDECEQESDVQLILRLLPQVKPSSLLRLRFLLTSRPDLPIRLGFQSITDEHQDLVLHEVPTPIVEGDISLFLQHKIGELRRTLVNRWPELHHDWPGNQRITTLVTMSVPLFIFAATVCRILGDPQWHPEESLGEILAHQNDKSNLDGTYLPVLNRLLRNQSGAKKMRLIQEYRMLIGTILILETPLPARSLSKLAGIQKESMSLRLDSLHAVLSVPDDETKPVKVFHLSFRDFLLDLDARDKTPFWINEKEMHEVLMNQCLGVMRCSLSRNICNLPGEGTKKSDIDPQLVDRHLSLELRYACRYWSQHLVQSQNPAGAIEKVFLILKVHFLHWVEAMSILDLVSEVFGALHRVHSSIQNSEEGEILAFLHDARRFILKNRQMADIAPLQLYSSGLMFCPRNSVIRKLFEDNLSNWHRVPYVEEEWSAELQTLEGHSSWVNSVAFSPNGWLLVSGSEDHTIKIWDPTTGKLRQTLEDHSDGVTSISFSPDGRLLASGSDDHTIKIWDPTTGELRQTLEDHSDGVTSINFSTDGELRQTLRSHSYEVTSINFSPDGRLLASGCNDHTIELWDPTIGELRQTLEGHLDEVRSVTFSLDGRLLASGSDDQTIKIWDPTTGELRQTLEGHSSWVSSVAFSPNGWLLVSGSGDHTIKLWDPITGELHQTLEGHSEGVKSINFSPDGLLLASGCSDDAIKLWDPKTGQSRQTLEGHSNLVGSVIFSPDGLLASSSYDCMIKTWDASTGELLQTFADHADWVMPIDFSPKDGWLLASGSVDYTIKLWNAITGELRHSLKGHSNWVQTVKFSPNGRLLASGSGDLTV
ncbi:purine and uridine phosphorylase [Penicillium sp. IBT 35674x]|nr:purine and uridine phosphorylase [Penicillium sp. IBT 35674x]